SLRSVLHLAPHFSLLFSPVTALTARYTLSLHDALPISIATPELLTVTRFPVVTFDAYLPEVTVLPAGFADWQPLQNEIGYWWPVDRKSTRLNSSHVSISYAVFCLKKKNRAGRPSRRQRH